MKINTKVLLIILLISISHIQSASFGMLKKSVNRNLKSNTSNNSSVSTKGNPSKGISSSYYSVSTSITSSKSVTTSSSSSSSTQTTRGGDIPDYNIYYEGWVKYLRYNESKNNKPKAFFKNTRFAPESRSKFNGPEKDSVR